MLSPGTVGKAAKQGERRVATRQELHYEQSWDRQNTLNAMQQMVMEEARRRQQEMLKQYGGPPPMILGGLKSGGNI